MNTQLNEGKSKLLEAEVKYQEQQKFFAALPVRIKSAEEKVAQLMVNLEDARRSRPKMIEAIANNRATEENLTNLSQEIGSLESHLRDGQDVLVQLIKTQNEARTKIIELGRNLEGKKHSFWYAVSEIELAAAVKNLEENLSPLLRAWAAFNLSGISVTFGIFLKNRLGIIPSEKVNTGVIQKKLLAEYLGRKED